jgi:hypothetical protein
VYLIYLQFAFIFGPISIQENGSIKPICPSINLQKQFKTAELPSAENESSGDILKAK